MDNPIIFLDIDGVLNGHDFCDAAQSSSLDKRCVERLNIVLGHTGAHIVISSAWRYMIIGGAMTTRGFEHMLRTHGLAVHDKVLGHTVADEEIPTRGAQISNWLDNNCRRGCKYVVIDDLDLDISAKGHPLVLTAGRVGLTDDNCNTILKILGVW